MDSSRSDALGALKWGLRKYAWVLGVYVLLVAVVLPVVALRAPERYDSHALVIAQRLDMDMVALPRYAESVFDNGAVARAVDTSFADTGDFEDIVPALVSLQAEQDSIVLTVIGHASDPAVAAELADVASEAFVAELNRAGEGVGAFAVQSRATPPTTPVDQLPSLALLVPVSLVAGLLLGVAAVGVVLLARRPVLEPGDAEEATGIPVLGTVTLPRPPRNGALPAPEQVPGIAPLCRRLLTQGTDGLVVVSPARWQAARRALVGVIALVLSRVRPVELVADDALRSAVEAGGANPPTGHERPLVVADGADPLLLLEHSASTMELLLVPHGMPVRELRGVVAEQLGGGPAGLVLVRRGRRHAPAVRPDGEAGAPRHPTPQTGERLAVPVPGRH